MKKFTVLAALLLLAVPVFMHSSIITNTNQSAIFYRLLARNASMQIDAVYYNPAGLTQLKDGWHLSLHNQTIYQEKTITNSYPFLNDPKYVGDVNIPFFPTFFAAYKKNKLALSFGFGPNAGGGTADFKTGLPSFEIPISNVPMLVNGFGIPTSAYSADLAFKGRSIYYGLQFNASYALSDIFALAAGFRYIIAENTYEGAIENIMINPMHPLINPSGAKMSAAQFFTAAGLPAYAAQVKDKAVDVKQTGNGFTPILGLNLRPSEKLNIGLKYEFNTKLELENKTTKDDTGMFPDGEKSMNDIPALLAGGIEYSVLEQLRAHFSFTLYFDKSTDWDGREKLVNSNTYDIAFGLEYDITEAFLLSAGYLHTQIDVDKEYQTDLSHELSSDTFGGGARYTINDRFNLDLGVIYVSYKDDTKSISYPLIGSFPEKYSRTTWAFALGIGYRF
ncbi:MAG: autotransporter domain-containing protein [Candidatus Aminicenantaceae bacterium]